MFITKKRLLVGVVFILLLQSVTATATDDEHEYDHDLHQSRELATAPPWATGSICTPDGLFYNPKDVALCKECCQERKCHNRCLKQCKNNAANKAQNRKDYCKSYDGEKRDGPSTWGTCSDKLGEYKESHCGDYDDCVTKYEARHIANDAWYYCDDLKPPHRDCSAFGLCVYKKIESIAKNKAGAADKECSAPDGFCGKCTTGQTLKWPEGTCEISCDDCTTGGCADYTKCVYDFYEADAAKEKREAYESCDPSCCKSKYGDVGEWCKDFVPEWHPECGHWRDDWYDACKAKDCDHILKDLQYADAHSKSGSKGRHAVCDEFWECVNDYERYDEDSYSRDQGDDARRDCRQCENSGRNCKNVVGNDHEQGKDDACLSYLGGWDRSCNSYYDCWNSRLKGECEDCANSIGIGCGAKFDECKSSCMQSPIEECKAECDVCFCESDDPDDPEAALEECQAIGADCCKDPYGYLNDPDMKSLEYRRECSPSFDCGTCRGNCKTNADCHNANVCSKDIKNPRDIYDIPGCKGDPKYAKDRFGKAPPSDLDPLEDIGYCYKPSNIKDYPDRTFLINSCLAETTTNGYGRCCGLPRFAEECDKKNFNNYCDRHQLDVLIVQPGTPGTATDTSGTPIFEVARYTGSYCGTSVEQICSSCPSNIEEARECSDCTNDPNPDVGCFSNFICEGCLVQTGVVGVERSYGGEP